MKKLPKVLTKSKKRIGRGMGSGKGSHTVGRGQKGQKSRGHKTHILFEGMKVKKSLLKRLPFKRGKNKFHGAGKPVIIDLAALEILAKGTVINLETLIKSRIVDAKDAKEFGVKILGNGEITKAMTIMVAISGSAAKKVEKAGGKVESLGQAGGVEVKKKKVEDNEGAKK